MDIAKSFLPLLQVFAAELAESTKPTFQTFTSRRFPLGSERIGARRPLISTIVSCSWSNSFGFGRSSGCVSRVLAEAIAQKRED